MKILGLTSGYNSGDIIQIYLIYIILLFLKSRDVFPKIYLYL